MPDPQRWADGGFHVLRGLVSAQEQLELAECGKQIAAAAPFVVPRMRDGTPFRCSVTAAGAAVFLSDPTHGYHYARQHPISHNTLPEIPRLAHVIAHRALERSGVFVPLDFSFDTLLLNRYRAELGESLGLHVDEQEEDLDSPLVAYSIGADAEFLIGSTDRDFKPDRVIISSGDGVVMSGPSRLWHHGVRRVLPVMFSPLPPGEREAYLARRVFLR
jgi:alkylated DNA repair protein (DNA oxidative demethylase)